MAEVVDYEVEFPSLAQEVDQDAEWVTLRNGEGARRIRLHDYHEIYDVPGLYETVFCEHLECRSPGVVVGMLEDTMREYGDSPRPLRALDFGAGNGMVGQCLTGLGCELLVGVDIIEEAKKAAYRDRPGLYDDYHVMDLARENGSVYADLQSKRFTAMVTVAALGFGDIPPRAFVRAFNLVRDGGWVAFNIKDVFLDHADDSGFRNTLEEMNGHVLDIKKTHRYRHRLSIAGEPLHYIAVVGRKRRDMAVN